MSDDLFSERSTFPNLIAQSKYADLVGLDHIKERLEKEAEVLLRADLFETWSKEKHGSRIKALDLLEKRPPLFIFSGDVGTGKTELASTFGDALARSTSSHVSFFNLSLRTRGSGMVGEMTKLITDAFAEISKAFPPRPTGTKAKNSAILLIDEADSLAQSRATAQMHHEDRAGVNALIRGIDHISNTKVPCLTVMCTNRLNAMDPAVQRRAAAVFEFTRPTQEQRLDLLQKTLDGVEISEHDLAKVAEALGPHGKDGIGFTFSDITQKFIPTLVLTAYPHKKITKHLALEVAASIAPTPPFKEAGSD